MAGTKVIVPAWDSSASGWTEFRDKFESFVDMHDHGTDILDFVLRTLKRGDQRRFVATDDIELSFAYGAPPNDAASVDAHDSDHDEEHENHDKPAITTVHDFTPEHKALDRRLYSYLDQSISGNKRTVLKATSVRSWVQAWGLLHKEMGASTMKRKTDLLHQLISIPYSGPPEKYKQQLIHLVENIYQANISVEDLIMYSISSSLPEEFLPIKVLQSQKIEESKSTPTAVFNFIDFTCTTIEMSSATTNRESARALKAGIEENKQACTRCGRTNHDVSKCHAQYHIDGTPLEPTPKSDQEKLRHERQKEKQLATLTEATEEALADMGDAPEDSATAKQKAIDLAKALYAKAKAY